jgi:hypothetical protein
MTEAQEEQQREGEECFSYFKTQSSNFDSLFHLSFADTKGNKMSHEKWASSFFQSSLLLITKDQEEEEKEGGS